MYNVRGEEPHAPRFDDVGMIHFYFLPPILSGILDETSWLDGDRDTLGWPL